MAALSRYVLSLASSPLVTASTQWFERTLDDSANKRLVVPQGFLAVDAILNLYLNISAGMVVYPKVIARHVQAELPFMATETILMEAVQAGGDRQELHERIREHSMAASYRIKAEGLENDLIARIKADAAFGITPERIDAIMDAENFIGRAPGQVDDFLADCVYPLLQAHRDALGIAGDVSV